MGSGGTATFADSSLPVGSNVITAVYSGDSRHLQGDSNPLTQLVTAPAAVAPKVVSVHRFGYHMQPTTIVIRFSMALNAASAADASNYRIVTLGGRSRDGELVGHAAVIKKAVYNPLTFSVTLSPAGRLDFHNRYKLTVSGSTRSGVRANSGTPLDGDGSPGTEYTTILTNLSLSGPAPGFAARQLSAAGGRTGPATPRR